MKCMICDKPTNNPVLCSPCEDDVTAEIIVFAQEHKDDENVNGGNWTLLHTHRKTLEVYGA